MQATIAQADLVKAFKALKLTLPPAKAALIPATAGIHLKGDSTSNTVTATTFNTDSFIQVELPAQNVQDGERVVPGKLFMDFVSRVDGDIEILPDKDPIHTILSYGSGNPARITCFDPATYPALPQFNPTNSFDVSTDELKLMVQRVAWAYKRDEVESKDLILTGVGISLKPDPNGGPSTLAMSCTNRVEGAWKAIPVTAQGDFDLVIDAHSLIEVASIMPPNEICTISWDNAFVMFRAGNVTYFGRQLASRYPDLRGLFGKILNNAVAQFETKRSELLRALELVAVMVSGPGPYDNEAELTFDQNGLKIFGQSDNGHITEHVAGTLTGQDVTINVKVPLVINALKAMGVEDITFQLTGPKSPGLIHPTGSQDELYLFVAVSERRP